MEYNYIYVNKVEITDDWRENVIKYFDYINEYLLWNYNDGKKSIYIIRGNEVIDGKEYSDLMWDGCEIIKIYSEDIFDYDLWEDFYSYYEDHDVDYVFSKKDKMFYLLINNDEKFYVVDLCGGCNGIFVIDDFKHKDDLLEKYNNRVLGLL